MLSTALKSGEESLLAGVKYGRPSMQIALVVQLFWSIASIIILFGESFLWFSVDGMSRSTWQGLLWGGFGFNFLCLVAAFFSDHRNAAEGRSDAAKTVKHIAGMTMTLFLYGAILYTLPRDHHTHPTNPTIDLARVKLGERAATLNLAFVGVAGAYGFGKMYPMFELLFKFLFGGICGCFMNIPKHVGL